MDAIATPWSAARRSFEIESDAIAAALKVIPENTFMQAVSALAQTERIAASGCGHSGIACMHFAHLMCCIERPARFLSPAEATHGGTGFLKAGDVILLASRGGKTRELIPIMEIARKKGAKIIAVTENQASPLAMGSDIVLPLAVTRETDRFNSQGTTSFIVLSAIFDALQSALIEITDYRNESFALIQPGGAVGERLNRCEK